ncbi:hypothetical protein E2986_13180 [Frieseomelitta varia]|uniref:Uncharacterized protein n=1 Tax=Frieseomelitta varia TaxID=561572 RepID=A0A833RFQ7_9HYME|nr:hypothetical protein E2986_13180 [Frieseomelitta varia]
MPYVEHVDQCRIFDLEHDVYVVEQRGRGEHWMKGAHRPRCYLSVTTSLLRMLDSLRINKFLTWRRSDSRGLGEMRRIKRFVLAQSTEKDPIWKSSDNLMAGIPKMNGETSTEPISAPEPSTKEQQSSTTGLT